MQVGDGSTNYTFDFTDNYMMDMQFVKWEVSSFDCTTCAHPCHLNGSIKVSGNLCAVASVDHQRFRFAQEVQTILVNHTYGLNELKFDLQEPMVAGGVPVRGPDPSCKWGWNSME